MTIEAAFQRACAAIDEAWQLVRELQSARSYRINTLSSSLADPREQQIEFVLSNARVVIQNDANRNAMLAVARAALAHGLITEAAFARLVRDYDA